MGGDLVDHVPAVVEEQGGGDEGPGFRLGVPGIALLEPPPSLVVVDEDKSADRAASHTG